MNAHDEKTRKLKENIEQKVEDLTIASAEHDPDSEEVAAAKQKRALAEKELVDSRDSGQQRQ